MLGHVNNYYYFLILTSLRSRRSTDITVMGLRADDLVFLRYKTILGN